MILPFGHFLVAVFSLFFLLYQKNSLNFVRYLFTVQLLCIHKRNRESKFSNFRNISLKFSLNQWIQGLKNNTIHFLHLTHNRISISINDSLSVSAFIPISMILFFYYSSSLDLVKCKYLIHYTRFSSCCCECMSIYIEITEYISLLYSSALSCLFMNGFMNGWREELC